MAVIQNKIVNGGFEAGLSGWVSQNTTIVGTPTIEGFFAALLQGGNLNSSLIQSVQAGPGDTFELKLSITRDTVGTTPIVAVSIAYFNAANALLGYGLIENIRVPNASVRLYQAVYNNVSPAPAGTVRAEVAILRQASTGTAGIFVDQIILKQIINDASGAVPVLFPSVPDEDQQSENDFRLFPGPNFTNILSMNAVTTQPNQRVKIDATIELKFESARFTMNYETGALFVLRRDGQTLLEIRPFEKLQIFGGINAEKLLENDIYPNITFIDVVPNPGTHNYTIDGFVNIESNPGNFVTIETRGINATVFPPGAGPV